jgi:hypothetical protein
MRHNGGCRAPWKGCWSPAGENPDREIVIAPGSSRDSREGDRTVEAFDGKGCLAAPRACRP